MNHFLSPLSYKYARAFLNHVGKTISYDVVHTLAQAGTALDQNKDVLSYMNIARHDSANMFASIMRYLNSFGVEENTLSDLVTLLIDHRRLALLGQVLRAIQDLYRDDHRIGTCSITSAYALTEEQKQTLEKDILSLQKYATIEFIYHLDPALIAGIRIQLDLLLWEYSVDQQLQLVRNSLAEVYSGT